MRRRQQSVVLAVSIEQKSRLLAAARAAARHAHCPYSHFHVGAAVLGDDRIYVGCNVENASYSLTICAERVAACMAIAAGARRILAIAVVGNSNTPVYPCGACLQFIAEFASNSTPIICGTMDQRGGPKTCETLVGLLAKAFRSVPSRQKKK